ncbi:MAG: tRNA pseudouridine(55) synthase TruB [Gammaproteobacteria bacterium]|nr:tRNA pseudouridine(55) synthase TruB [Gammaproteobacteria bacterium]
MSDGRVRRDVHGIALLDKPLGLSSNSALQQLKRLYGARRAGHTGSLDPLATGMLPVCFGEATKVTAFLLDADKTYRFRMRFGSQTTTGDLEGDVVVTGEERVEETALRGAVAAMTGPGRQVPPMYSALKHQGRRLYDIARSGRSVERQAREILVSTFEISDFDPGEPQFVVRCSKGTYVRTLAEDLAGRLGTVGHVTELRRLAVGPFEEREMRTLASFEAAAGGSQDALDGLLEPLDRAVADRPPIALTAPDAACICHGQTVALAPYGPVVGLVRLYDPAGAFLGMGEALPDGRLLPRRLVAEGARLRPGEAGLYLS